MARLKTCIWRPLGGRPEPRLVTKNKVIIHTMVGSLNGTDTWFRELNGPGFEGTESHVGTGYQPDGDLAGYQWQDTDYQADAQLEGNDDCISVETADHGGPYRPWSGSDVPAWTDEHLELNAQIVAEICRIHNIPPVLIEDTEHDTRGIGYHRQGIDPWRDQGSERYSGSFGKVCPGDRRVAQMPRLIRRVREILEEDMPLTNDEISRIADAVSDSVWLRKVEHPWTGDRMNMQNILRYGYARTDSTFIRVRAIVESFTADLPGIDTQALAEKIAVAVANEQAERMQE